MSKKYRLKNRQRFITFLFLLFLLILFTGSITSSIAGNIAENDQFVTVRPGDTLWDIAQKYSGNREIREYIYYIKKANQLDNAIIYAGQKLCLP